MARSLPPLPRQPASLAGLLAGLLLVLPIGQHAAAGLLVCFGADGHVDVEDGRWSDCATDNVAVDPHAPLPLAQEYSVDDCGDCIDVPFMVNPAEGRVAIEPAGPTTDDYATAPVLLVLTADAMRSVVSVSPPPAPPPSMAGLQTVVLRV